MDEITDAEFAQADMERLREFAILIHDSGLSVYEIAKGCRMAWKTVKRAVMCLPVHSQSEARIRYYIETARKRGQNEDGRETTPRLPQGGKGRD